MQSSADQLRRYTAARYGLECAMGLELACRVLLIYPRFVSETFWNFAETCELMGARYPAAPLGLITVAAMLPPHCYLQCTEVRFQMPSSWVKMFLVDCPQLSASATHNGR